MLQTFNPLHRAVVTRHDGPRLVIARRFSRWLLRCWVSACRRAERRGRFVPYY
jgi:hypothetical protein